MDLQSLLRRIYNQIHRLGLKNHDFSLIASNCNGGSILHDLGMPFNSPFVNLWLKPRDFIRFCNNLEDFLGMRLSFVHEEGIDYPVGQLGDIRIYFQHYKTAEEAEESWYRRAKRINRKNLFLLATDRDGWTDKDFLAFEALPFRNKVVFTHIKHPEYQSAFYIPGFEDKNEVGMCMHYVSSKSYKKYYDAFDYVAWFNNGSLEL